MGKDYLTHTCLVTETGVTGCVSSTRDKPMLGTLTRAAEQMIPQSITCAVVVWKVKTEKL